jgi:NADH-quinone oxidoreductase subunit M
MTNYLLSFLIFIPLLAALVLLFVPTAQRTYFKWIALAATLAQLVVAAIAWMLLPASGMAGVDQLANFAFVEQYNWIQLGLGNFGILSIEYLLGVDGISFPMVLLSALVLVIGVVASWKIDKQQKGYYALYLLLAASIMGCFLALDFFLFFLFFEFMLLPMYFLIGIWGGVRREYAAIKFFLYTLLGSVLILIVMIALNLSVIDPVKTGVNAGLIQDAGMVDAEQILMVQEALRKDRIERRAMVHSFNMLHMMDVRNYIPRTTLSKIGEGELFGKSARYIAFLALLIGFLIKLPAVPLHTWLPDAHVEAPTAISVILAGILLKIGGYGLIRTAYSIFPDGADYYSYFVAILGLLALIYGAMVAMAQHDLKRLIAYSSVSHMGMVLLGLAALTIEGVSGAIYQMFSHGLISSMLFLVAGVIYDRTHDRMIENYSGLASKMPRYTAVTVIACFASLGLPGFSGFIAEIMIFIGAFKAKSTTGMFPVWIAIAATLGLILTAAYYLWTLQRMFFGAFSVKFPEMQDKLSDLSMREYVMFVPLIIAIVLFGIFPNLILNMMQGSVEAFCQLVLSGN